MWEPLEKPSKRDLVVDSLERSLDALEGTMDVPVDEIVALGEAVSRRGLSELEALGAQGYALWLRLNVLVERAVVHGDPVPPRLEVLAHRLSVTSFSPKQRAGGDVA